MRINKRFYISFLVIFILFAVRILLHQKGKVTGTLCRYILNPPQNLAQRGNKQTATKLKLFRPMGLAEDKNGNVYIVDRGLWKGNGVQGGAIWKIDTDGIAHAIAGNGKIGDVKVGNNALNSPLRSPEEIAISTLGEIYFADHQNHIVLKIRKDQRLIRVAGTGKSDSTGDGGDAVEATLNKPYDVKLDSKGNVYIAEEFHRIRKISPKGVITTVAGTGKPGFSGDNGPAIKAQLNKPWNIFIDNQDQLLIADSLNHVIRQVNQNGKITTIAGTGTAGYSGDGKSALMAQFDAPQALYIDDIGQLYISDEHNHAIRIIALDGTVSTLIGNGKSGMSESGTSASNAQLNDPEDVLVRKDGSILISDSVNGRVLEINSDNTIEIFAGRHKRMGENFIEAICETSFFL